MDWISYTSLAFLIIILYIGSMHFYIKKIVWHLASIENLLKSSEASSSKRLKQIKQVLMVISDFVQGDICSNCAERHHYSAEQCRKEEKEMEEFQNFEQD